MKNFKLKPKSIMDIVMIILLLLISIKKGGFYKSDTILFNLFICIIGLGYVIYNIVKDIRNKEYKVDLIGIGLLFFPIAYMLPIVLGNYSNLSDSIFEMIRYINMYLIYKIVRSSDNKKWYINAIIGVTLIQCLIGIDGIANRYLTGILEIFESGYLSRDLTRLSSTLQYANVLAILCTISSLFVINKISKIRTEVENEKRNIGKFLLQYVMLFIFITSIILTGSRLVIILTIIAILVYVIKNKKSNINMMFMLFTQLIQSIIYTTVVYNFMSKSQGYIYLIFIIAIIINVIIGLFTYKLRIYFENKEKTVKNLSAKKRWTFIGVVLVTILYIGVGLNLPKDLKVIANTKESTVTKNLYRLKQGSNNINFKIEDLEQDSRYKIVIYKVDREFNQSELKTFNYFDNVSGEFNFDFELDEKMRYLTFKIECEKGAIKVDNIILNDKKQKLDYHILPTEVIDRLKDSLHGSSSVRDRFAFCKDSVKIALKEPLNLVIGVGGEGFANLYETVQTVNYISSETHSFVLQLFVESGIIGLIILIVVIIFAFKLTKPGISRYTFFIILIHVIFDLDMSYMFMITIFAILLGTLEYKENIKLNEKMFILLEGLVGIFISIFGIVILTKANIAYNTQIEQYSDKDLTLKKEISIVEQMQNMVNMDNYEVAYKKSLNSEYEKYLKLLVAQRRVYEKEDKEYAAALTMEIDNTVKNIKNNIDAMLKYDKYNKYTIIAVANCYIDNLSYFVDKYYSEDKETGYKQYLTFIIELIDKLDTQYTINKNAKILAKDAYKRYYEKLNTENETLNSVQIDNIIKLLQEKI